MEVGRLKQKNRAFPSHTLSTPSLMPSWLKVCHLVRKMVEGENVHHSWKRVFLESSAPRWSQIMIINSDRFWVPREETDGRPRKWDFPPEQGWYVLRFQMGWNKEYSAGILLSPLHIFILRFSDVMLLMKEKGVSDWHKLGGYLHVVYRDPHADCQKGCTRGCKRRGGMKLWDFFSAPLSPGLLMYPHPFS